MVGITGTRKRSGYHKDDRLALSPTTYIVRQREQKCDMLYRFA